MHHKRRSAHEAKCQKQAQRPQKDIFKILRTEHCQPRIPYTVKREGHIKTCSDKGWESVCSRSITIVFPGYCYGISSFQKLVNFCPSLVFWHLLCSAWIPSRSFTALPRSTMNVALIFSAANFIFLLQVWRSCSLRKVEEELNGSVFSWPLVNIISPVLSPGLIFYWSLFLLDTLWLLRAFWAIITGNNMLYFCSLLKIFLLAKLTLE